MRFILGFILLGIGSVAVFFTLISGIYLLYVGLSTRDGYVLLMLFVLSISGVILSALGIYKLNQPSR